MAETIKIVAADDHRIFLEGLKSLFHLTPELDLVAVCEDGDTLLSLIEQKNPAIALVDISMPGANTETIVEIVESKYPETQIIALTMHLDPMLAKKLITLGLSGYVMKEEAFDELSKAITAVNLGEQFISPKLMNLISSPHLTPDSCVPALTNREMSVLSHAANGSTNKEIARVLTISERTVRFHLSNSCIKLGAHGRSNAVAIALKRKILLF